MNTELIEKRLASILSCVELLETRAEPSRLESDPVQRDFCEHRLQLATQASLDVGSMIVATLRDVEPKTNREIMELLVSKGWLPADGQQNWLNMVAFRNIIVHQYLDVDVRVLRQILADHLDDLRVFVRSIRDRLADGTPG